MDNFELFQDRNPVLAFEAQLNTEQEQAIVPSYILTDETICLIHGASYSIVEPLLSWLVLDNKHKIFIFDNDWKAFLEQKEAKDILIHPQIAFFGVRGEHHLKKAAWQSLFKKVLFIGCRASSQHLKECFFFIKESIELSFADFRDFGVHIFSNAVSNWTKIQNAYTLEPIKNALKDQPAIICGAGPSLYEHLEELKQLEQRAYLFGGARVSEMLKGIALDFGGVIDPTYCSSEAFSSAQAIFYQDRADPQMLASCKAPLIWSGVAKGYPMLDRCYQQMGLEFSFETGWNVSNFLMQVALYLGCNPILFVGQDHCYEGTHKYPETMAHSDNMPLILAKDKQGHDVWTKRDFLLSLEWIKESMTQHTETRFFTMGNRGMDIPLVDSWQGSLPLLNKKRLPLIECAFPFDKGDLRQDLSRALLLIMQLYRELKQMMYDWQVTQQKTFNARFTLYDVELKEEECYHHLLRPLWDFWKNSLDDFDGVYEDQPFDQKAIQAKIIEHLFYKDIIHQWMPILTTPDSP